MSMVKEVILTDKDGQQILPITRHTQVYVGNERLSAYLDNSFGLLSTAVQSLQSQIDSVASRDSFDELHVTSFFADTLVGTDMYGTLHGNADSATTAAGYTAGGGIAAALAAKQNTINPDNKLPYSYLSGTPTIGNGIIYFALGTGSSRTDFQMFTLNQTDNKIIGLYRGSHIQIEHTAESGSLSPEGFTISTDIVDADATHKGLVTTATQTLAGDKTFTGNVTSNKQIVGRQGVSAMGINDLTVFGNGVSGSAVGVVRYDEAQELTDEEQAQARENIGAGTYSKPSAGIPKTDLAEEVQESLDKADTALQQHQSLADYATKTYADQRGGMFFGAMQVVRGSTFDGTPNPNYARGCRFLIVTSSQLTIYLVANQNVDEQYFLIANSSGGTLNVVFAAKNNDGVVKGDTSLTINADESYVVSHISLGETTNTAIVMSKKV